MCAWTAIPSTNTSVFYEAAKPHALDKHIKIYLEDFVKNMMSPTVAFFQVFVDGTETTAVLRGLTPLTQYSVNVYSVVGEESSEPLQGTETTRTLSFFFAISIHLMEAGNLKSKPNVMSISFKQNLEL